MSEAFEELMTEAQNPATLAIDTYSAEQILRAINGEDQKVPLAVAGEIPRIAQAVEIIVEALGSGGRLFYVGAGTSGRLGVLDASECPPTFGTDPETVQAVLAGGDAAVSRAAETAEDEPELGCRDILARGAGRGDVVVGIAASGRTPYVAGALSAAREAGARVIAVVCNRPSALEKIAEITIAPVVGPEVIMGSTRLKAGTAQKLVLNMLSTAAMIRLGKVYKNLMVDLRPGNAKLVERARRMVRMATGVSQTAADGAYRAAGGDVKVAIVMLNASIDPVRARDLLSRSGGHVRRAIELAAAGGVHP